MSELEMLQRKFAEIDGIGWEVYNFIDDCDKQLKNGANEKAVAESIKMAVKFYGTRNVSRVVNMFPAVTRFVIWRM